MRSDVIKKGVTRAPHRSLLKALGITDEEMNKPFIGVAQAANEIIPDKGKSPPAMQSFSCWFLPYPGFR